MTFVDGYGVVPGGDDGGLVVDVLDDDGDGQLVAAAAVQVAHSRLVITRHLDGYQCIDIYIRYTERIYGIKQNYTTIRRIRKQRKYMQYTKLQSDCDIYCSFGPNKHCPKTF